MYIIGQDISDEQTVMGTVSQVSGWIEVMSAPNTHRRMKGRHEKLGTKMARTKNQMGTASLSVDCGEV